MRFPHQSVIPAFTLGLALSAGAAPEYSIEVIALPPDSGPVHTLAKVVSPSGLVAGQKDSNYWRAWVTTPDGEAVVVHPPSPPQDPRYISSARAIADSGAAVVVYSVPPPGDGAYTSHVFRFTPSGGLEDLRGAELGAPSVFGQSIQDVFISEDGRIAVTWHYSLRQHAWLFTDENAWQEIGGLIPGNTSGFAKVMGIGHDGSVYVSPWPSYGTVWRYTPAGDMEFVTNSPQYGFQDINAFGQLAGSMQEAGVQVACRYTPGESVENLQTLPEAYTSFAKAISGGGTVGGAWRDESGATQHGFVYVDGLGMLDAGVEANGVFVTDVSDDGTLVGGLNFQNYDFTGFASFRDTGPVLLQDLVDPDIATYEFITPTAITDDGILVLAARLVSGPGLVTLVLTPVEPACPGDLDGDGAVDTTDLNIVLSAFGCTGGGCAGDADGDGDTDTTDLNVVLSGFGSGCP